MKLLLVTTLLLMGSTSFANFTGIWRGDGTLTRKDGSQFFCEEIILNITQSKDSFTFGKFYYGCNYLAISFVPPVLSIDNNNVFWKEQNVGTFTENDAKLVFPIAADKKNRYTVQKLSDTEMNYLDEQIDMDSNGVEEIVSIKAKLFKSNN